MPKTAKYYYPPVYCGAGQPENPPTCIRINAYAKKYHLTVRQIQTLLKHRKLRGIKFRHKMFIEDVPPEVD